MEGSQGGGTGVWGIGRTGGGVEKVVRGASGVEVGRGRVPR